MRIGIIGTGNIGGTLAHHLVRAGHDVAVSNSRGPDSLAELTQQIGGSIRAVTVSDAIAFGDVVVVSIPFGRCRELPESGWDGKIVIDTCNYYPARDGHFPELDEDRTTSSELVAQHLHGARVVKAFNSIYARNLRDSGLPAGDPERLAIPIAGDDPDAVATALRLIDEIGFDAVMAGPLAAGRRFQRGTPPYGQLGTMDELEAALSRS